MVSRDFRLNMANYKRNIADIYQTGVTNIPASDDFLDVVNI